MRLLRPERRSIRKIYLVNFILVFGILTLIQAGLIYLLRIHTFLEKWLDSSAFSLFLFSSLCLLASFLLVYYMLRELFRAIDQLNAAIRKVAKGDYTVQLSSDTIIAEVQDMEENFNQMVHELNSVEMLRKDFVADVSHEFRTPLASISGYITLLQDPELTEAERDEYIRMAIFNADRLNQLTENILRLSRLETQQKLPESSCYRLDEQIREAIVLLERQWNEKNIQLDIDLQEVQYFGCRPLLLQVWSNLIGNAIKFSSQGGRIHIQLSQAPGGVHVGIRDWGIGMNAETQAHIFEKFYQGDTSRRGHGNGLGLALCKEIVTRCGGEIIVNSQAGEGSTFTVILPDK